MSADLGEYPDILRAQEWVWQYMRGNVKAAVVVEQGGPPIRPSAVIGAVMTLLAEQGLVLAPMRAGDSGEEVADADNAEG